VGSIPAGGTAVYGIYARLAQLVEQPVYTGKVGGSSPSSRTMKEIYCKVYGMVQGVFYRKFVQEKAQAFNVTGFAKNLEDGTVEIVAQGREEDLRKFLEPVSAGPDSAEVESINVSWGPLPEEKFTQFDIL
jgi:acylphosphatase